LRSELTDAPFPDLEATMSTGRPPAPPQVPISLEPTEGWHCSHFYYRFDRGVLAGMSPEKLQAGREAILAILDPAGPDAPQRLQTSVVSGHKADFSLMLMDPHPLKIERVNQRLLASPLGPATRADVLVCLGD
jgi:hydrogen peroxide-dependent heme synthase